MLTTSTLRESGKTLDYKILAVLLADIFKSFRNKYLAIYDLDPTHFYLLLFFQHMDSHGRHVWREQKSNWNY